MSSLNKVTLIGYVGKEPEIRQFQDGTPVANLSLATSKKWTDKESGEKKEATEWHRIVFTRGLAGVVERYVKKAALIYVEGELKTRKFNDKETGVEKYTTEIWADELIMLGGRRDEDVMTGASPKPKKSGGSQVAIDDDQDVPF